MAKKPARSGGRVTPKGTQPADRRKTGAAAPLAVDHRLVNRFDPAQQRQHGSSSGPTRSGHHRGQR